MFNSTSIGHCNPASRGDAAGGCAEIKARRRGFGGGGKEEEALGWLSLLRVVQLLPERVVAVVSRDALAAVRLDNLGEEKKTSATHYTVALW